MRICRSLPSSASRILVFVLRRARSHYLGLSVACALTWGGLANADPAPAAPTPPAEATNHGDPFVLLAPESELEHCEPAPAEASPPATERVEDVTEGESGETPRPATPAAAVISPAASPAPDADSTYWTTERVVGWSLLGGAAAASAVAIYFYDQQRDADERYQELSSAPASDAGDRLTDIEDEYERARSTSLVAASMALGFAATGATLLILGNSEATVGAGPQLVVEATGARVGFAGRF